MKNRTLHIIIFAFVALLLGLTACGPGKKVQKPSGHYDQSHHLTSKEQAALVKEAKKWIGTKYVRGGHSRSGTDCSGMVMEVYLTVCDVKLPRRSRDQQAFCKEVSKKDLREGDLVFFCTGAERVVSHVGIYIGEGKMIHASSSRGVMISGLDERYFQRTYHSSGRVFASADKPSKSSTSGTPNPKTNPKTTPKTKPAKPAAPKPTAIAPPQELIEESQQVIQQQLNEPFEVQPDSVYSNMFD